MKEWTLVTGGAGFVGSGLVRQLRENGEKVRSFDLAAPLTADDVQGSITDADALNGAMRGVGTVYHLAGNAQLWSRDECVFDLVNRQGTQNVVDEALAAGVDRLIHCSSLTTLVGEDTPIGTSNADETKYLPADQMLGAYPRSKREAELLVEKAHRDHGLHGVIVLPTEPLGPGDEAVTPPTKMILDFANGATPAYIDCILNFVPAASLARGMIAAADRGGAAERYLLGGVNTPMARLLAEIASVTGRAAPTMKMPYWVALAAGLIETKLVAPVTGKQPKAPLTGVRLAGRQVSFSSDKAREELGWRADPYEPALGETIAWFEEQGWLRKNIS